MNLPKAISRGLPRAVLPALVALLVAAASPAARAQGQEPPADAAPSARIAAETAPEADRRIAARLRGILDELGGYDGVRIRVADGVVHLDGEVADNAARARLETIAGRIEGVVAVENAVALPRDLDRRLTPAIDRLGGRLRALGEGAPLLLVALAAGGLIAFGGWWLAGRTRLWQRLAPNAFVAEVYLMLARLGLLLLGLSVALEILDATALLGAVLGAAGVAGLALGFAVRDTVENFIASLMLSLRQPFRPNDFVEIEGSAGRVARLTARATILISPEGNHIRIPNATVFKGRIVNYTRDPQRRFSFTLGVDAESDLAAALATGVAAIKALPFVLEDPPVGAWVQDVGESNVILTFTGWVDQIRTDFMKARGEAVRAAKLALESAGFGLPEPIYRVRLDGAAAPAAAAQLTAPPRPAVLGPEAPRGAAPPPEADPGGSVDPTEEAVVRERRAADAGEDLLHPASRGE
ncbi:MAG: BON domain-containing protein [Alphaproteobacteria bacterium]|nr:MAG: BON domain-containing protein [Alphaproteobacteria bacterium]